MTLDEAIRHCEEVAEEQSRLYSLCPCPCDGTDNCMSLKNGKDMGCTKCAADHRQLAEWLRELKDLRAEQNDQYVFIHELMSELKEAKRLLKTAVEDIYKARQGCNCNICDMPTEPTERCQYENGEDCQFKWLYADEALKLIES